MSKKPVIKKISHDEIADITDKDTCIYYLSYNEEMTQIVLSVNAGRSITPEEYLDALAHFIDDVSEFPENLFVDTPDNEHLN